MIYKIHSVTESGKTIYSKIDDDGLCRVTCSEDDQEFKAWVELGNTPEPAEE
jgi:hypothetical protein